MPELPEVETTARLVRPGLEGRSIRAVEVLWTRTLGGLDGDSFAEAVVGTRVSEVRRRAKFIVVDLSRRGKPAGHLFVHLRMSGRLFVEPHDFDAGKHLRVRLELDRKSLFFVDIRKFGRFQYVEDEAAFTRSIGPEPLGENFTVESFRTALSGRKRAIKPLLLDQSFVAGLGNIYVDESLHRAGLHPLRRADRIPKTKVARLHGEIRATLAEAIEREGSSIDTFYRTPEGRPGSYQHQFQVYGRTGRPCRSCGRAIRKIVVGQRGTHYCTRCQPAPRRSTIPPS